MKEKLAEIGNYKNFNTQLAILDRMADPGNLTVSLNGFEGCSSTLSKSGTELELVIDGVFAPSEPEKGVKAEVDGKSVILYSRDLLYPYNTRLLSGVRAVHRYEVNRMQTADFGNAPDIYRCYFPSNVKQLNTFIFLFETLHYQTDRTLYGYDCIRISAQGIPYDILQVKHDGRGYYVFENLDPVSLESFKDTCFAIQQAVGFLTGYMPGGEEYIFRGTDFSYTSKVRQAMKSIYNPINTNAYSKLYDHHEAAEKYHGKLTKIPASVASRLIDLLCSNGDFSATVILTMEAASVRSLLLIPSAFSVIIESLSRIIAVPQSGSHVPISDKLLAKEIISGLQGYLDSYSHVLSTPDLLTLKRRLGGINRPVVLQKLTNNEKLTQPFGQLGIALSLADITAIEHRNDLLHGDILLSDGKELADEQVNAYMMYVSGKLYTLISKLILKYAGYDGYVINYAKFSDEEFAATEDFYDLI